MTSSAPVIIILSIIISIILIAGIVVMAIGGKINRKYSNKLMVFRILSQAFLVITLFILFI